MSMLNIYDILFAHIQQEENDVCLKQLLPGQHRGRSLWSMTALFITEALKAVC